MNTTLFIKLFQTDLNKLKTEINLYNKKSNIWVIDPEISNSGGNLCLHIVGNLNHFIGFAIGKTDYLRNRESEFLTKNIPSAVLIEEIEEVSKIIADTIGNLLDENLQEQYPIHKFEENASIEFTLIHLLSHLNYHLGQVNYHRRLFDL